MNKSKTYLLIATTIIIILVLSILFYFLNTGSIKIITDKVNTVYEVTSTKGAVNKKKVSSGSYNARIGTGKHSFIISKGVDETQVSVNINRLENKSYTVNLVSSNKDSLVINNNISSLQANSDNLNFVDNSFQNIQKYNINNKLYSNFMINSNPKNIYKIKWLSPNKGIATMVGGYMVLVQPNGISKLDFNNSQLIGNDITKSNVDLYAGMNGVNYVIKVDDKLYIYNINNSTIKELQTGLDSSPEIITIGDLSLNNIFAYAILQSKNTVDTKVTKANYDINLINAETNESSKIQFDSEINNIKWSPDGKKIAISTINGIYIYDYQSKIKTTVLPYGSFNPTALNWINNNSIVYFNDNSLWCFNLASNYSNKVSNNKNTLYIEESTISTDGLYYYYVIPTSNSIGIPGSVYRILISDITN